ncbi:unnamed protein product, partial [marine sediment metagenome]
MSSSENEKEANSEHEAEVEQPIAGCACKKAANPKHKADVDQAIADCDWWHRVGKLIGATLSGWNYRQSATFIDPYTVVDGRMADVLLGLQDTIDRIPRYQDGPPALAGDIAYAHF